MGSVPSVMEAFDADSSLVARAILTLARLDAFICTVLYGFFDISVDKVDDYCKKLYHDIFTSFLRTTFSQVIAVTVTFVHE